MAQESATQDGPGAPAPVGRVLAQALLAGLIAGFAAGVIDTVWSWRGMAQFAPGAIERVRAVLFVGALYGCFGAALVWLATLACSLLVRASRLGDILRGLARAHQAARERDPKDALVGLSVAIAAVPVLAGCLSVAYWLALTNLAARKHLGLMLASAMALALIALIAAAVITLPVARLVEAGLGALCRRPRWARLLSAPRAPIYALFILLAVIGTASVVVSWKTLRLLDLRPYWIGLVTAVLVWPAWPLGRAWAVRLSARAPALRRAILIAIPLVLILAVLSLGSRDAARQAAVARTGLSSPLTRLIRQLSDFDRDGYSRLLGGGDCDDGNRLVHPGARDIPGDGIDNNCVGGDAVASKREPWSMWPVPDSVPKRTNVVLITIDTLRSDHLGAYGYGRDTSPNLDALAKDGALFANAWAHAPSTRYSIPAILTGRYPLEVSYFDIPRQWPGLAEDNTMLAEVTERRGLTGAAVLNYWYFDKHRKMDQGFRYYDNSNKRLHRGVPGKGPAQTTGSSSRQQTDKAIELIAKMADQRFFLWVHYYDPHYAYESHKEVPSFGPREIDRYDEEIRFTDLHIGRLIDYLRQQGLYDETIVVVTGDHGEGFGEHGIDLHGYHLYAAQTRVPLIIRVPGIEPTTVTMPAGHVDILPTIANLLGTNEPVDAMGKSLVGAMTGADQDDDRIVFQQLSYENNNEMRGAASALCHVIYNVSPHSSWEVYRIDRDPDESRDLSADPNRCGRVVDQLAVWYDETEAARRGRR